MVGDHAVIRGRDLGGGAVSDDLPAVEQEHSVAVLLESAKVVAHQDDGLAFTLVPAEGVEALFLEARVTHREDLVHHQEIGLREDRDAERETHLHAG